MSQVPGLIFLEKVRLSFPHLGAPHKSGPDAAPKYSADFIMEPGHPGYAAFYAAMNEKATEKWGPQAAQILQMIGMDKRLRCYGAGEEVIDKSTLQPYPSHVGMVYIKANNSNQPALRDAQANPLMNSTALYGGCYVNAQIQVWMQDNVHGRGVRAELVGVQFHSDGEAFGAAPVDPNTLFGAIPGAPVATASTPGVQPGAVPGQLPGVQPGAVPGQLPGVQQPMAPPVQQPGGYNPAAYTPAAAPAAVTPQVPGIDPVTGLPVQQ